MSKILLTGGAGFIGSKTGQILMERGEEIVCVDNFNDYYDVELKKHRLKILRNYENFEYHEMDIEDRDALEKIFRDNEFSCVINLAARAGVRYSIENPHVYVSTNIAGTVNLLEMMRKYEIKKFVLASSSSVYAGEEMPFTEKLEVNKPISPYAASKKAAEMMAYTYNSLFDIDSSVLRYFTVYGPYGRPDMSYFRFIKQIDEGEPVIIYGDGNQSRDFTYIDDIAEGTIKSMKYLGYELLNLGGGKDPVTINYMLAKIEEYLGKKAKIEYREFQKADMKSTGANIEKAKEILGWEPHTAIDEGLKNTVEWYKQNKEWLKDIKL